MDHKILNQICGTILIKGVPSNSIALCGLKGIG